MSSTSAVVEVVALGAATASISWTCTIASVFAGVREKVAARSEWLGEMLACPYCFGHYVAYALVGATGVRLGLGVPIVDFLVTSFSVITAMALFHWPLGKVYSPVMQARALLEQVRAIKEYDGATEDQKAD